MDRSFWAKAGTICLLPCSMFHAKCSHSTPHNRVSLLHASVFLLLIVFSLSVLVPFLEAGNYCPHRTIHTLCMSYTWELILYHLVYFPRFYSQGYFSLFVSKSSIVKRTKKWLCFVICPSQDLTSLPSALLSMYNPQVWQRINHLFFSMGACDIPELTLLGALLVKI